MKEIAVALAEIVFLAACLFGLFGMDGGDTYTVPVVVSQR